VGRRKSGNPISGWLALDKPIGISSTQALAKARHYLNASKAGHAGTLDPLASGVLPLAFGEATKVVSFAVDKDKRYQFEVEWGKSTDTDDSEGKIIFQSNIIPTVSAIDSSLGRFIGIIDQVPPKYSAIKIKGKRAYQLARQNIDVPLVGRKVEIKRFTRIEQSQVSNRTTFEIDCGKGTYVRALARDLALCLGTYAHVTKLRRSICGPFNEKIAISLDQLKYLGHNTDVSNLLLPVRTVLDDIPALALTAEEANSIRHGRALSLSLISERTSERALADGITVQTILNDRLVALAILKNDLVQPIKVLN
jgi:tRNA pseudouridine55 synthase